MRLIICTFIFLAFTSCHSVQDTNDRLYPSDYLFAQRSFPHGEIDHLAFRAALNYKKNIPSTKKLDREWESKGPYNIQGRITDIETYNDGQDFILAGTASGGIYRSSNLGQSWEAIFDDAASLSIGDMAVHSDPNIMFVGTGEANAGGGSLAYDGVGIYKSIDGGNSWSSKGLEGVGSIGKVIIDPINSDKVYVAAMGHLFDNNPERGVYRTQDGGDSWELVLSVSDSTGAIDMAINPNNPDIIYAAMWERIRRPYNRQYGGVTGGIYKSTDGGSNWTELTNGLPVDAADKGRIGLALSESNPNIIYAYYANANGAIKGVYRSDDAGDSWIEKSIEGITNVSYIWWFGKIFVHPTNSDKLYVTSINMSSSDDGGDTWDNPFVGVHADQHAIAFMPEDPSMVINGNDGGLYLSPDEGVSYTNMPGYSNIQFYTCEINPHNPKVLLGGTQDNGTLITEEAVDGWSRIFGGDGFRVLVDPKDPNIVYAESQYGNIGRSDDGGQSFSSARSGITGASNWNTPIAIDPQETNILYTGTQNLFQSTNRGENWFNISPPLVNDNNPTGNLTFGSLTTIDVSKIDTDVIYVGTDDGNVWVTKDRGNSYDNISEGLPQRWITAVAADPHNVSKVYVTVSGFRFGESSAQVFVSDNYGEDWISIGDNLPDIPVNDIIIDEEHAEYLYLATDIGVFISHDFGSNWTFLGESLPNVPITDLDFDQASRTLAAATYGRGLYTIDVKDITNTKELANEQLHVYPNPSSDYLTIPYQDFNSISIFNEQGQKVLETQEGEISIKHLEAGQYSIIINYNNGRVTQKFIKI